MEHNAPVTIIIFGATGDLAEKKLFPSLFRLFLHGYLRDDSFCIVGFARRTFTDQAFADLVEKWCVAAIASNEVNHDEVQEKLRRFLSHIRYHQGYFDELTAYQGLLPVLEKIDAAFGRCSHKLFHLSLSPFFYQSVLENMDRSGLQISCVDGPGKTRVLLEKPIGIDAKSAKKINALLARIFKEEQIFRVDHYLMKMPLWDLLTMHFTEPKLRDVWNRNFIDHIELHLFEKIDIQGRGTFYDHVGALRDVGQNHLLQMLALIAMEKPATPDAKAFRKERQRVLSKLALPKLSRKLPRLIRGQYEGYEAEEGIETGSQTETFFSYEAHVKLARWKGVSFILSAGKALDASVTEAVVYFKNDDRMEFCLQPAPRVVFHIGGKTDALSWKQIQEHLGHTHASPDGYEKVYHDALHGEQAGFVERGEIEASWKHVDAVRRVWKSLPLATYPKGSKPLHFGEKLE